VCRGRKSRDEGGPVNAKIKKILATDLRRFKDAVCVSAHKGVRKSKRESERATEREREKCGRQKHSYNLFSSLKNAACVSAHKGEEQCDREQARERAREQEKDREMLQSKIFLQLISIVQKCGMCERDNARVRGSERESESKSEREKCGSQKCSCNWCLSLQRCGSCL